MTSREFSKKFDQLQSKQDFEHIFCSCLCNSSRRTINCAIYNGGKVQLWRIFFPGILWMKTKGPNIYFIQDINRDFDI